MNTYKKPIMAIIVLLTTISIVTGCQGDFSDYTDVKAGNGYRMLIVRNELCSFSLEYRDIYKQTGPEGGLDYDIPFIDVWLTSAEKSMQLLYPKDANNLDEVTASYIPAIILVSVYNTSNSNLGAINSNGRLENDIDDWGKWENFKLLERKHVTISGVKGELIAYVVDWFIPVPRGDEPLLQYHRAVYFDHNGHIWVIEAKSEMDMIDQIKADFDHIIETFKILN